MTLTSPNCPVAESLPKMVKDNILKIDDVPEDLSDLESRIKNSQKNNTFIRSVVGCPLMHGTGMWLGAFLPLLLGGTVITTKNLGFDPDQMWSQVEETRATNIVIVGDAFAKPMLDALNNADSTGNPYNLESVQVIISSGVMWSAEVKQGLLEHHDMALMDTMGSTEGGMGSSVTTRDNPATIAGRAEGKINEYKDLNFEKPRLLPKSIKFCD